MDAGTPVWQDAPWQEPPALQGEHVADVCVVGLGGSGLSCIEELLSLGQRVIGLDAGMVAGGAAGRNGGFLLAGTAAFYHDSVRTIGRERARAVYLRTLDQVERIASACPQAVRQVGSLRIFSSDEEAADGDAQYTAMRADRLPVERYDGPEGQGLRFPLDAAFQPLTRCHLLAEQVQAAGAQLFAHSRATSIAPGLVETPEGRVRCRTVIVAVDGALDRLLPQVRGKVWSVRLQMLATEPTDEIRLPYPVYRRWGYDYWQQLADGRIALGGFRDRDDGAADAAVQAHPTVVVQQALEDMLRTQIGVSAPVSHRWAALVGYTRDHVPFVGEVLPGVWALGGYSGTGNVIGALCGRGVAQQVVRGTTSLLAGII